MNHLYIQISVAMKSSLLKYPFSIHIYVIQFSHSISFNGFTLFEGLKQVPHSGKEAFHQQLSCSLFVATGIILSTNCCYAMLLVRQLLL
jgi:hypothetical protein